MTAQLASLQDAKRLRSTLGAAFWDDPVWHYTIGSGRNFERRVGVLMGIAAKTSLRQNTVWTAGDGDAFAVWSPPPMPPKDNVKDQLLSLPQAAWAAGRHAGRGIKVLEAMRRQHPHDRPHWYLAILGTHPSAQGKGIGSAALRRTPRSGLSGILERGQHPVLRTSRISGRTAHRVAEQMSPGLGDVA